MTDEQIDMRTVSAPHDFPGVTAASVSVEVPVFPGFRIIEVNPGTFVQAISCPGQPFIPAVGVSQIQFGRGEIPGFIGLSLWDM